MAMLYRMRTLFVATIWLIGSALATAEGVTYIDVRTSSEFDQGHIEGALLMPYDQINTLISGTNIGKQSPIVLYCRSGKRAGIALQTLLEMGYTNVSNAGGYRELATSLESKECAADSC